MCGAILLLTPLYPYGMHKDLVFFDFFMCVTSAYFEDTIICFKYSYKRYSPFVCLMYADNILSPLPPQRIALGFQK